MDRCVKKSGQSEALNLNSNTYSTFIILVDYPYSKTKWAFSSGASVTALNGPQERISHQQRRKECMYVCMYKKEIKKRKKEIRFKQLFPTRKFLFLSPLLLPCLLQDDFTLVAPPTVHCFSILYCTYSEGGVGKSKAEEEL